MERLFDVILSMSLNASALVLVVLALRLMFANAPKWLHCLMWGLVAFKLICPLSVEDVYAVTPPLDSVESLLRSAATREVLTAEPEKTGEFFAVTTEKVPPEEDGEGTQFSERPSADSERPNDNNAMARLPAAVWLTGAAALLLYGAGSYLRLKRRLADAVPVEGTTLPIYRSDRIQTAFLCGVVKPKIYLPFRLEEKGEETERQVIAHEAAHLQRGDHLTKVFAFVLAAVYWFNPVIWLAYVLYARDMELACDEKVIRGRSEEERKAYSRALLACAEENSAFLIHNAVPVRFGEIAVKKRVTNVLYKKKPAAWLIGTGVAVLVLVGWHFLTKPLSFSSFYSVSNEDLARYTVEVPEELDRAVADAMFAEIGISPSDITVDGKTYRYAAIRDDDDMIWYECAGEGHLILGYQETESAAEVYMMGGWGSYQFINGKFVGGCALNPLLLRFDKDADGNYIYQSCEEPLDGTLFYDSVYQMFPKDVADQYFKIDAYTHNRLQRVVSEQCSRYAEGYLKMLGRTAEIGEYRDFDFKILSDYGVSDEVDNELFSLYDDYNLAEIGEQECLEYGKRIVYRVSWDGNRWGSGVVTYMKYEYDSGKVIEKDSYRIKGKSFTCIEGNDRRLTKREAGSESDDDSDSDVYFNGVPYGTNLFASAEQEP